MEDLSKGLSKVDSKVEKLRQKFEKFTKEAAALKINLDKENETLEAAGNLIGKLDGEFHRWSAQVLTSKDLS